MTAHADAAFSEAVCEAADRLRETLGGTPVDVAGAALVDLLAQWICSHRSLDPAEERRVHKELLSLQVAQLREFVRLYTAPDG